jgi:hypothetical protein
VAAQRNGAARVSKQWLVRFNPRGLSQGPESRSLSHEAQSMKFDPRVQAESGSKPPALVGLRRNDMLAADVSRQKRKVN